MKKSDKEWQQQLTTEQYEVTRCKGTESPFSGEYHSHTEPGIYHCICCDAPLFSSKAKYDAGCGWPSFTQTVTKSALIENPDYSHGMLRTEVCCSVCNAHLGHLFTDGPPPTGLRYCINSVALSFKK